MTFYSISENADVKIDIFKISEKIILNNRISTIDLSYKYDKLKGGFLPILLLNFF